MYQFTCINIRIKGNLPLCQVSIVIVLVSHLRPKQGQVFLLFFFNSPRNGFDFMEWVFKCNQKVIDYSHNICATIQHTGITY